MAKQAVLRARLAPQREVLTGDGCLNGGGVTGMCATQGVLLHGFAHLCCCWNWFLPPGLSHVLRLWSGCPLSWSVNGCLSDDVLSAVAGLLTPYYRHVEGQGGNVCQGSGCPCSHGGARVTQGGGQPTRLPCALAMYTSTCGSGHLSSQTHMMQRHEGWA